MSQPESSQAIRQAIEELNDELAYQQTILNSLDDNVLEREAAEQEVRGEIRTISRKLRDLKRGTASSSQPRGSSQSRGPNPPGSSGSQFGGGAEESSLKAAMNGNQAREQWNFAPASSTSSTPNSISGDLLSPSGTRLVNRKRSHSSHLDGQLASIDSMSKRRSPSPYPAGPATPSTASSGDDTFEDFERDFFTQQKNEEQRLKREKDDEEFARSLQDGSNMSSSSSMQPPARSAFDRLSGAHQQQANVEAAPPYASQHGPGRKLPWAPSSAVKTEVQPGTGFRPYASSISSGIKRETPASSTPGGFNPYASSIPSSMKREAPASSTSSFSPYASSARIKPEAASRPMPGSFREDTPDASDSDIEIIPSSAFRDNGRRPQLKAMPASPRGSSSSSALDIAMYGTQQKPEWMNGNTPGMMQNGGSGFVYPQAGGSMQAGPFHRDMSSSFTMNNIPAYNGYGAANQQEVAGPSHMSNHNPLADIIARSGNNNFDELTNYLNLGDQMNGQLDYIMNDPRKTDQEIKDLLENIRPDMDLAPENREGTPEGLVYPLYEHQKLGLAWMKSMETGTNKGGILADDMGLGKTISALALMLANPSTDRARKTTLIVGPVALVRQWDREITKKIKQPYRLSTHMVHGQTKKFSWDELRNFDVVLTTYGTLAAEFKRLQKFLDKMKLDNNTHYDQNPMKKDFPLLGPKSTFYRTFLDEAQCIKNKSTGAARACCNIQSVYRFCLTGTPMMNNVGELYSLVHFLRIKPYNEWTRFQQTFGVLTKTVKGSNNSQQGRDNAMRKLQALLKAILLRRTKSSKIDGKPIITLPSKTEEIQHVVFSEDEQSFYTALETKTVIQFNKYMKANTVGRNYSNVLVLLLRLRQACCHPHLIHDFEQATPDIPAEVMVDLAKSLGPDVVKRVLEAEEGFECGICQDAGTSRTIIFPCGHDFCFECLIRVIETETAKEQHNDGEGSSTPRCPTCRGSLARDKLIDYKSFETAHKAVVGPVEVDDDETASDTQSDSDTDSDDDETESDSQNSDGDLRDFIVPDDIADTEDEAEEDNDEELAPKESKPKSKSKGKEKEKEKLRRHKSKGKKKEPKKHVSIAMLKKEANKSAEARRRYVKYLRKNWQPSAKVTKCVDLLEHFIDDGLKTIVFSQFVSLLDLVQVPIDQKQWKCLRYDGSMSADARNDAINTFTDSQSHNIMLISLKAGNAGLNLVAASRVIILDPFWNPYIEMQAVDRAHRIGQQREVEVHRILIAGTVEDRIIELQEKKRALVESALDEKASASVGRLGVRELAFLFGVGAA